MNPSLSTLTQKYLTPHLLVPMAIALVALYCVLPEREISPPPGIRAPAPPLLYILAAAPSFPFLGYSITPMADYDLTARILDKAFYHWGRGADISPLDLLLGWKEMSDSAVLSSFSFHLSGRWYTWRARELPLPLDAINQNLDNNHLIPSTALIEQQLKGARIGETVHIHGYLVSVSGPKGFNWSSSMNVGSTGGPMSCKLIYVTAFDVVH